MIQRRGVTRQRGGSSIKNRNVTGRGVEAKYVQGTLRFIKRSAFDMPGCMLNHHTITIIVTECHALPIPVRIKLQFNQGAILQANVNITPSGQGAVIA